MKLPLTRTFPRYSGDAFLKALKAELRIAKLKSDIQTSMASLRCDRNEVALQFRNAPVPDERRPHATPSSIHARASLSKPEVPIALRELGPSRTKSGGSRSFSSLATIPAQLLFVTRRSWPVGTPSLRENDRARILLYLVDPILQNNHPCRSQTCFLVKPVARLLVVGSAVL